MLQPEASTSVAPWTTGSGSITGLLITSWTCSDAAIRWWPSQMSCIEGVPGRARWSSRGPQGRGEGPQDGLFHRRDRPAARPRVGADVHPVDVIHVRVADHADPPADVEADGVEHERVQVRDVARA